MASFWHLQAPPRSGAGSQILASLVAPHSGKCERASRKLPPHRDRFPPNCRKLSPHPYPFSPSCDPLPPHPYWFPLNHHELPLYPYSLPLNGSSGRLNPNSSRQADHQHSRSPAVKLSTATGLAEVRWRCAVV